MLAGRWSIHSGRLAAACLLLAFAAAAVACSPAPAPDASRPASVLAALPFPPSASMTVGAEGPGMDGDAQFYAYTSERAPQPERQAYDGVLRAAGYTPVRESGGWTAYRRDGSTVWISVSPDGPPTSIVALVAADPSAAGVPASVQGDPAGGSQMANVPPPEPATPEPKSRTSPDASPRGQGTQPGGGHTAAPATAEPTPSPEPTATPKSTATPKPHPSQKPHPSHPAQASPTPTPTPKPKPKPKPTPTSKPSPASSKGDTHS